MIQIYLTFIVGALVGGGIVYIYKNSLSKGMDVEEAISILKSRGYWVRINIDPKEK